MMSKPIIESVMLAFEVAGVVALVVGALAAGVAYVRTLLRRPDEGAQAYGELRKGFGRAILIGLELLIAADIIRTVAIEPTLLDVSVLALIVLVRTFLSWSLELEINGRWPWQETPPSPAVGAASDTVDKAA